ncbi:MAG: hypothetical protein LUH14_06090 [Clostridiaceae bacterium]|nr:hypothetical protein [Clostridiaceae bacterium]
MALAALRKIGGVFVAAQVWECNAIAPGQIVTASKSGSDKETCCNGSFLKSILMGQVLIGGWDEKK